MSGTKKSGLERVWEGLGELAGLSRQEIADPLTEQGQVVLQRGTRTLSERGSAAKAHALRRIREAVPGVSDDDITAIAKAICELATDTRPLGGPKAK
jgi:hypothetical protein